MVVLRSDSGNRHGLLKPLAVFVLCVLLLLGVQAEAFAPAVFANASGAKTLTGGKVTVDVSNANQGYIMIRHSGSSKRLKVRITYDGTKSEYDLNNKGDYEAFPLLQGSGKYLIEVFENIKGKEYSKVFNKSFDARLDDELAAFTAPNQYVWYTPNSLAVAKSYEICAGIETNYEKATAIYQYVTTTLTYDYIKAMTVQKGYLPDIDDTLNTRMGICFDYSALMACMLRVQGIPTQLVIGDLVSQGQYHAWNIVYIDGMKVLMDSTFSNAYGKDDYVMERYY